MDYLPGELKFMSNYHLGLGDCSCLKPAASVRMSGPLSASPSNLTYLVLHGSTVSW
jgi:hypothetical protein